MHTIVPVIKYPNSNDLILPLKSWDNICSFLSKPSLLCLRLVCSKLNKIALPYAYRNIRLEGLQGSSERFVKIAKDPKLRDLARQLTVDTSVNLDFNYNCNGDYPFPTEFLDALPYIRYFGHLTIVHLRFNQYCGEDDRTGKTIEETWNFRYRVLDTLFHCIAGTWTTDKQMEIEEKAGDELYDYERTYPKDDFGASLNQIIQLKELTIANLADFHDLRLANSEAFKKVMSLPSLINLKVFVTTEQDEDSDESHAYYEEKYEFFDYFPQTWLATSLSDNLRVLSLYGRDFWGWFPKMDFRNIDFPQLQVLALGHYVFSHNWQIDWISSIGRNNGTAGLRELYLDDCPILFQALQASPLDVTDPGYPIASTVLDQETPEMYRFSIRWSDILSKWATSMKGLRVFRMGHGHWQAEEAPQDTLESVCIDLEGDIGCENLLEYRLSNNTHRSFACPEPIDRDYGDEDVDKICASGKYLAGTGINERGGCKLQYIKYNINIGPSPWRETFWSYMLDEEGFEPEKGTWARDKAAFEELSLTVKARVAGL
ncbi:hypothetical protein NM208_g460 [Fusarium decemcellulare]|uniref:Uncharacterized protein n=1 Tax=Fusarium decemcellulare TaxID=57161 RepID=A0ACC1SZL7_9HYPO|nr:hypothetical protein NM208_g460 [Fusarium decemcellulare]